MSYEKHTWETGETITAEKLNNLEDGIAEGGSGGVEFIPLLNKSITLDVDSDKLDIVHQITASGAYIDAKSFYELIGDKTVLGLKIVSTEGSRDLLRLMEDVSVNVTGKWYSSTLFAKKYNEGDETIRNGGHGGSFSFFVGYTNVNNISVDVTIYAICI